MSLKLKHGLIFAFLIFNFSLLAPEAQAHKYHSTLTRMDYNEKEKNIEITIQLFIHDALPMLERRLKKRVDIEKTPEADGELLKYLSENFVFQNKKGEAQRLKWVGREFENDTVYVYLEIPYAESFEGARLQNTIFFESFVQQINLVVARFGDKKVDLLFKAGERLKEF